MPLDYIDKYDVAAEASDNILGTVKNFAVSTAADVATTLWNSLPFTPEAKTEDVLDAVDKDSLHFYQENTDTVKTASMIGGAFIPGGVALKLLGRARAGVTTLGYTESGISAAVKGAFTGQRQKYLTLEIEKTFAESGAGTAQYKALTRQLYLSNIGQAVMDNAIIEGAVVGVMNAHPYMEEYLKDPLQNFAIGVGIGGVLGTALSIPATRRAIIDATGGIELASHKRILESNYQPIIQKDQSLTETAAVQRHTTNITILDDIILNKEETPLTRDIAKRLRDAEGAQRALAVERAAPWITEADDDVKNAVITIMKDPKYLGVDKIKWYDLSKPGVKDTARTATMMTEEQMQEMANLISKSSGDPALETALKKAAATSLSETFLTPEGKAAVAFVRLSTGETFAATGARNAALAVDIRDIRSMIKQGSTGQNATVVTNPRTDFFYENLLRGKSSAQIDAEFLVELKRMDNVKTTEIPHITVAPDHLPRMNALLAKFSDMAPEEQAKISVRFRNDYATHDQVVSYITQKVEAGALGVDPTYFKKLDNLAYTRQKELGLYDRVGSRNQSILESWQGSTNQDLRSNLESFFTGSGTGSATMGREMYEAGAAFRAEMSKLADPDGNVVLYRALHGNRKEISHRFVEGYSNKPLHDFGTPKAYKIHVDNIVGIIGSYKYQNEAEILVMAPRHETVDISKIGARAQVAPATEIPIPAMPKETQITLPELYQRYADETTRQINELIGSKLMSFEEISARTNTQIDAVRAVAAGHSLADYPSTWIRYSDASKLDTYLHPNNKLYAVMGNPVKNPNSAAFIQLDSRSMSTAQKDVFRQMTLQSNSRIGNDVLDLLGQREMDLQLQSLQNNLAEVGNVRVGDVRYQSADQALRNLVSGPTVTYLGKQLIDRVDAMKRRLLEPLASAFTPFRGRPELFAEFNTVTNKLYSLQGWRDIRMDTETGFGYIVQRQAVEGKMAEVPLKNADGTIAYIKQKEVLSALDSTREVSNEMLKLHNLTRHMTGRAPMNDLGFYLPPINLVGKSFAYVIDNTGKEPVKLLVANKGDELASLISSYSKENADKVSKNEISIVNKGQHQDDWNLAKGYTDYEAYTTYADNAKFHTGTSAQAIVPSDARFVENIMAGYENLTVQGYRKYAESYMSDTMAWLDKMSTYYSKDVEGQPKQGLFKEKVKDSALAVKNILLGRDQLESSVGLKAVNSLTDFLYNRASSGINAVAKSFQTEKVGSKEFFDSLNQTLKNKGIDAPWKSFDEYLSTTVAETRNIAPKIQSAANGLLATLNLRMFETAQAAVNVMSLPILTWSALMEKLPGTAINPQGNMLKFPLEVMYDGIKHMFSDAGKNMDKVWESAGLLKQVTRQYTEVTAALKGASQGREFVDHAVEAANNLQNNKWIKDVFSKPSDFAEELTRKFAMHTGYLAAKRAYPGIDDTAATIAASAFADRTIGNYHAAQRPAMFQGTFGAAIGLYQTYVLTYAQSIYRSLENRNFKQLASLSIAQSALFGISSWPGFHTLSEQVVGRVSDQHVDLTTGTYRAIQDPAARLILYGLPSSLGPAFYTRGDVSPRIPSTMNEIAVFNGIKQGWSAASQIVQKASEGLTTGNAGQSMLEALSLQSLNRPIARWAELASGSSITTQFNTMSPSSEMFTPMGVFARMIGTRPLEEQVTRNAVYLNRYYEALDKERRAVAVDKLATAIRANNLTGETVSKVADQYMRAGGHAQGWRNTLNQTMLESEHGARWEMMRHFEPNSPLNLMLKDLY